MVSQKNALSESSLRSYNPSKPSSLACRLQAASGDLSDVSACRMMILKVRFFWDTLYIDKNLLAISILFNKSENFQACSLAFGDICLIAFSLSLLLPSQQADSNLKSGTAFILLFSPSLGHSEEPSLSFSCLLFSCLTSWPREPNWDWLRCSANFFSAIFLCPPVQRNLVHGLGSFGNQEEMFRCPPPSYNFGRSAGFEQFLCYENFRYKTQSWISKSFEI